MSTGSTEKPKLSQAKQDVLARLLRGESANVRLPRRTSSGPAPLSHAQQRLWLLWQLYPESPHYNVPGMLRFQGDLDLGALERTLNEIVRRHEALRTSFAVVDGQLAQIVAGTHRFALPVEDVSASLDPEGEMRRRASVEQRRPFDLATLPLLRAIVYRLSPDGHVLLLVFHHVVVDGWSIRIFNREITALYAAFVQGKPSPLPELLLQYSDYACWERSQRDERKPHLRYWKSKLANLATLELPADRPLEDAPDFSGATHVFELPAALGRSLKSFATAEKSTLFMVLLAGFNALLHRYTGQEDIAIGSPIAQRTRTELEDLIGFFANTLVLRTDVHGELGFQKLLGRVRETCRGAYAHQEIAFDLLVNELQPERHTHQNPLFQVALALQERLGDERGEIRLPGLRVTPEPVGVDATRLDIELHFTEGAGTVRCHAIYRKALFDASTIERMMKHLVRLLEGAMADPARPIATLPLLDDGDLAGLAQAWRSASPPHQAATQPAPATIQQAFEAQVERAPGAVALVFGGRSWTYREIDRLGVELAGSLRSVGVGAGSVVVIMLPPTPSLIIGVLGVLKAGAGFLLVEPSAPDAYVARLERGVSPAAWVLEHGRQGPACAGGARALHVELEPAFQGSGGGAVRCTVQPEQPAHLTLSALGAVVAIEHGALLARVVALQELAPLSPEDAVLHHAPCRLDAAAWEMLWPLAYGARVVLASAQERASLIELRRLAARERVSLVRLAAPALARWLRDAEAAAPDPQPRTIVVQGGRPDEPGLGALVARSRSRLFFTMGAVEVDAVLAAESCEPGQAPSEASGARAGHGVTLLLLDAYDQLVPLGVYGEVCAASAGMVRGYLGAPGDTARAFVSSPVPGAYAGTAFRTGLRGRLMQDGSLQLQSSPRAVWLDDGPIDPGIIERVLLEHPSVEDCAVLSRATPEARREMVSYVVARGALDVHALREHVSAHLPADLRPHAYAGVLKLPLAPSGDLDAPALMRAPVIDQALLERSESILNASPAVVDGVVAAISIPIEEPMVHPWDLVPRHLSSRVGAAPREAAPTPPSPAEAQPRGVLALAEGPELDEDRVPRCLTDALKRAASDPEPRGITFIQAANGGGARQSYAQLLEQARRVAAGLRARGLAPGAKVVLQLADNQLFVLGLWGCVLAGVIVVPIAVPPSYEHGGAVGKLQNAWKLLGEPTILTTHEGARGLAALGARDERRYHVAILEDLLPHAPAGELHRAAPDDVALMLLTSGSAGIPKAVMLRHRNILCGSAATAAKNGFQSTDVSLNWMPLDHVGGIVMFHLRDTCVACEQVHSPTELTLEEPLRWLDWINRYRVTITWAPNFAFGLVNERAAEMAGRRWDLSCLWFILNGGEAIVARTAKRFLDLLSPFGLPRTAMRPAWGMSETSSGIAYATFNPDDPIEEGVPVEVGTPLAGTSFRIVDRDNRLLGEGAIGRLQVKGASVTAGYYDNPEENRRAFTEDGWFDTGDLGVLRQGSLAITGREKDDIIINGVNYMAHEIEAAAEEVDGVEVSYTAAFAVGDHRSNTEDLAIALHTPLPQAGWASLLAAVRERVQQRIGVRPRYLLPLPKSAIPKTGIGKIQRSAIKRQLEAGEIDSVVKQVDLLLRAKCLIPSWFYRRTWRTKHARWLGAQLDPAQHCVLLLDRLGLGLAAVARLERAGLRCVQVIPGERFERIDTLRYQLSPADVEHWELLVSALGRDGITFDVVAHLLTYGEHDDLSSATELMEAQRRGSLSVLSLARALAGSQQRMARLCVVASHIYTPGPDGELAVANSTLPGLVQTIRREYPALACSLVDLPTRGGDACVSRLLSELFADGADVEVSYRGNRRLIPQLERLDWTGGEPLPLPLKNGGLYVVTGGLGGIGVELARLLLGAYSARLLLLGRTALAEPSPLSGRASGAGDLVAERRERLSELQTWGGEVAYEAVDMGDPERVTAAIRAAERSWGRACDGVFHLAGVLTERALGDETPEMVLQALRAKVAGAWSIHESLRDRPDAFVVHLSSVNGFFGGARVGAYAAASSFLDGFSAYETARCGRVSRCLSFSMWDDTGMSRGYKLKELTRASGYHVLAPEQGIQSLLAALGHDEHHVLIGLDGSRSNVYLREQGPPHARTGLVAYVVRATDATDAALPPTLPAVDRYGTELAWTVVGVAEIPRRGDGSVDRDELLRGSAGAQPAARLTARNDLERHVAAVWKSALGVSEIGVDENVFELGANSLVVAQVMFKIRAALGVDLPPTSVFKSPTVAGMAEAIASQGFGSAIDLSADARLDPVLVPEGLAAVDPRPEPRAVLLTGATGFLGAFLLRELMRQTRADVFCFVRAGDAEEGKRRVRDNLQAYRIWESSFEPRVSVVCGDLERSRLGLTDGAYDDLAGRVDLVLHNAALVNMSFPYSALKPANVDGTKEMLAFAARGRVKPFHFISTVATLAACSWRDLLREDDPIEHGARLRLGYVQSKWVAEKLVAASGARGLPFAIYRPGRVAGDTEHGACQANDFFWRLIKACIEIGAVPDLNAPELLVPVDFVASAAVYIALHEGATGKAFHLVSAKPVAFDDFRRWMVDAGYALETLPYTKWRERLLERAADDPDMSGYPLTALLPPDEATFVQRPPYDASNTEAALRDSGIRLPHVEQSLVETYFRYFQSTGFLPTSRADIKVPHEPA